MPFTKRQDSNLGNPKTAETTINMKSITQVPIDQDSLHKIIFHHFDKDTNIGDIKELADGWSSVAYSVELRDRDFDIIIKLGIPDGIPLQIYEHKLIETEIITIELIRAQ